MISNRDLYKEIGDAEDVMKNKDANSEDLLKVMIKMTCINAKLLHNLRTNTVRVMEHFNIEKVKPKRADDRDGGEKESKEKRD